MSSVKISGDPSGTGIFTISAPNSSTNRALVLPDSAGTLATSASTLAQFNASGSAPVFASRAWVNFNGTGTVAIRASGNVSSITRNGTGDYTVNFTTAMPDADYAVSHAFSRDPDGFTGNIATNNATGTNVSPTTSAIRVVTNGGAGLGGKDVSFVNVAVFR